MNRERLEVVIKSIGVNTISYQSFQQFMLQEPKKCCLEEIIQSEHVGKYINKFKTRKMSIATVLGIITVKEMLETIGIGASMLKDSGIVVGTNYACFDKVVEFYTSACKESGTIKSSVFSNSANSALSGEVAAELGMKAASFTISAGKLSAFEALYAGYQLINCGMTDRQVVAEIDACEMSDKEKSDDTEGAVALLLQKDDDQEENYGYLSFISEEEADALLLNNQNESIVMISTIREQADILLTAESKMLGLLYGCAILKSPAILDKWCSKQINEGSNVVDKVLIEVGDQGRKMFALIKKQKD